MNKSRLTIILMLVAMVASFTSMAYAAPTLQTAETLTIGVIGPIDGPTAQGVQLAAARLNANGPLVDANNTPYTIKVVAQDATTTDQVQLAIDELLKQNAKALFGPDDNQLALASKDMLDKAGVPVFTGATDTNLVTSGSIFRTRAANVVGAAALANVFVNDLKLTKIAVYQGSDIYSSQVVDFVKGLTDLGAQPVTTALQVTDTPISESVTVLLQVQPDAVVAFGEPAQVAELYRTLRANSFTGEYATNQTTERAFIEALAPDLRQGIYGYTNWSYVSIRPDNITFTRDYEVTFGNLPHSLSAAAYDAAVAIAISYSQAGLTATTDAVTTTLKGFAAASSLQGTFNPSLLDNSLSADALVIVTNDYGAPIIYARFNGTERLPAEQAAPPTALPSVTPTITPTFQGVVAIVKSAVLNVRSGPGTDYLKIGQLKKGDQVQLVGKNPEGTWFVINYQGSQGWISGDPTFVDIYGDRNTLPVVQPPPTPTPPPFTPTASLAPVADIQLVSATFNPTQPQPNQQFTLAVTIVNNGNQPAGEFAIATSFKPGEVYSAATVPAGLATGQQATVNLPGTVTGTGVFTIAIVLDLNAQIDEGAAGEANNKPEITYKVDRPFQSQSNATIATSQQVDLDQDGQMDIIFTGTSFDPTAVAALQTLGVDISQVHYDLVSSQLGAVPNGSNSIGGPPAPNTVIGVRTSTGKFGIIKVANYNAGNAQVDIFIYQ